PVEKRLISRVRIRVSETSFSTRESVVVRLAHFAGEIGGGFLGVFTLEHFLGRVPFEFLARAQCYDDEMADRGGKMAVFDFGNGVFARTHATEEVAHVIAADFQMDRIVGQGGVEDVIVAGCQIPAVDPYPAVRTCEFDPVPLAIPLENLAKRTVVQSGLD